MAITGFQKISHITLNGVDYDVKVRFKDQTGKELPLENFNPFNGNDQEKLKLNNLVTALAQAHIKNHPLTGPQEMRFDKLGAHFSGPTPITQTHDIAVAPPQTIDKDIYTQVAAIWTTTSKLLEDDYKRHTEKAPIATCNVKIKNEPGAARAEPEISLTPSTQPAKATPAPAAAPQPAPAAQPPIATSAPAQQPPAAPVQSPKAPQVAQVVEAVMKANAFKEAPSEANAKAVIEVLKKTKTPLDVLKELETISIQSCEKQKAKKKDQIQEADIKELLINAYINHLRSLDKTPSTKGKLSEVKTHLEGNKSTLIAGQEAEAKAALINIWIGEM